MYHGAARCPRHLGQLLPAVSLTGNAWYPLSIHVALLVVPGAGGHLWSHHRTCTQGAEHAANEGTSSLHAWNGAEQFQMIEKHIIVVISLLFANVL